MSRGRRRFGMRAATRTRRTRGRGRIEQRLERATRARAQRAPQGRLRGLDPSRAQTKSGRRVAIFALSLAAGALLASTAIEGFRGWWNGAPASVEAIAVLGNERLASADVAAATGLSRGQALQGLTESEIEERVQEHPWVRSANAALLPTGTLVVEIEERTPRAILRTAGVRVERVPGADAPLGSRSRSTLGPAGGVLYLVDDDCVPFTHVEPGEAAEFASLARLFASQAALHAEGTLCGGLALAEAASDLSDTPGLDALELSLPEPDSLDGFVLRTSTEREVLLGRGSDAEQHERLANLRTLFAANLEQLQDTRRIDLRFAGQAVLQGEETTH